MKTIISSCYPVASMYEGSLPCVGMININSSMDFYFPCNPGGYINKIILGVVSDTHLCFGTLTVKVKSDLGEVVNFSYDIDRDILNEGSLELVIQDGIQVNNGVRVLMQADYGIGSEPLYLMQGKNGWVGRVSGYTTDSYELKSTPRIAVIVPVHGVSQAVLHKALRSVGYQSYDNWEVSLHVERGDDKSLEVIHQFGERHTGKVAICHGHVDSGIAVSLNKAIANVSEGTDIYTFLDCDDELHPDALVNVAKVFSDDNEVAIVYTDEDKIDRGGKHSEPHYKPDFSKEMLLSQNYPCHLTAVSSKVLTPLLPDVFRKEYDGSQDHDFWLRVTAFMVPKQVVHIPKVLYHWRKSEGSVAENPSAKTWAFEAGYRAVRDHVLVHYPLSVTYRGLHAGTYRVQKHVKEWPDVYVIIPTRDNVDVLESCLQSIQGTEYRGRLKVHVVCNASTNETFDTVIGMRNRGLLNEIQRYEDKFNWSIINNTAVDSIFYADGAVNSPDIHKCALVFMNDDVEALDPYWLDEMVRELWQSGVGVVGSKLLYPDMRIQHAGVIIGMGGIAGHGHKRLYDTDPGYFCRPHLTQQVSAVTGACMAVRTEVFLGVHGFNEELPKAFNDVDFCLKVKQAGFSVVYTPWARLMHHESLSRGVDAGDDPTFQKAIKYMEVTWHCRSYRDPFFNPNLDLRREVFVPIG